MQKPEEMQDNLRAVMVWIHGGAFHMGSGSPYNYGPDFLLLQDVVVVLINYRLSVLGKKWPKVLSNSQLHLAQGRRQGGPTSNLKVWPHLFGRKKILYCRDIVQIFP